VSFAWIQLSSNILGTSDNKSVSPSAPIAVLDSGLGGLTVVKALQREMPHEDILYFGDTARVPYGSKSPGTIVGYVRQIRKEIPGISISGVIEPGAKAAAAAAGDKHAPVIGVIATEATVRSKAYEHALSRRRVRARLLFRPTPLLAPIVEEGRPLDDPVVVLTVEQYLRPMLKIGLDVLLLGCTHYPILRPLIETTVGPNVTVIDSAQACAEDVCRRLLLGGLLRGDSDKPGRLHCFVTDESQRFARQALRCVGMDIPTPTWVSPEELYRYGEEANQISN